MSGQPRWHYVQARLQARHGERLTEGDWHTLEAAHSFEHFLDRAQGTTLARFTAPLNATMTSHAIERRLRLEWRHYVAEIAAWLDTCWQPAVLWTAQIAELPAIAALLRGETPAWAKDDAQLAAFAEGDVSQRIAALEKSPLAPLTPGSDRPPGLAGRWGAHWQTLWPRSGKAETRALRGFTTLVAAHMAQLAMALPPDTSARHRLDLANSLTRLFRRHAASPVAVFSHLALAALDLERLRGNLVRRRLFETSQARAAA